MTPEADEVGGQCTGMTNEAHHQRQRAGKIQRRLRHIVLNAPATRMTR